VTKEQSTILKDMKNNLAQIPDYLIQRNKSFEEIIYQILSTIATTVYKSDHAHKIEAWTKIAIIIYKIMIIETYHRPWTIDYSISNKTILLNNCSNMSKTK
jgi:hypothetical protein